MPDGHKVSRLDEHHSPMQVCGHVLSNLVETYGTPTYFFDAEVLRDRLERVRQALSPRVTVLFALKANSNVAIARLLRQAGAGAEVASAGEILVSGAAGFDG